ncbi:DUF2798 domain-containing protein [Acidovorax sp. HMWF029]|uniref:DUF2798 domain-containing protein n=1 Tax=unclassified Acidovorax TaxID=2684926 RepID=UPI000D3C6C7B|nr:MULTISPECIES: DUF2798 domain-containing protein [unclassified Acidovorax]MDH4416717.1 DUF2798 domain-containing protein [Acidovorax sp.]PTT19215.1 DUF2798 domain-containing protein [Acidovorax sp. HMWF029]
MIPARYAPLLFSLILSGTMSLLVSGIATYRSLPPHQGFVGPWMSAWLTAWLFAFPAVLLAAPLTRRVVTWLITSPKPDGEAAE